MRIPNILPMLLLAWSVTAQNGPCEIYDLVASAGDCTSDSTYQLKLNFKVANPTDDQFDLYGNNHFIGTYNLSQLPLSFNNFPSMGNTGFVKVCINDNPACCRVYQFVAPVCPPAAPCKIYDVAVKTGDCNDDGTYKLALDFKVDHPGNDFFEVWAGNGKYLGYFPLSQLPLSLTFPWGGGAVDKIKICINDKPDCCIVKEFPVPDCFNPCQLRNLRVDVGDCTSDSTYAIKFKFEAPAGVDSFSVWAGNGKFLGRFAAADMPVGIANYPWGGGSTDAIKICVSNTCCRSKTFNVPECLAPPCGIVDLKVETGGCTTPNTYKVVLNFKVLNPSNLPLKFSVRADNGDLLGIYGTSALPLSLNFPWNGDEVDALEVCLLNPDGGELCCEVVQFKAPDCVGVSCGIFNLTAVPGDCNPDGTYQLKINFQTPAASLTKFGVWSGTGQFFGFYTIANLPILLKNFKPSGGSVDKVIICFTSGCCQTKEFNAPDCAGPSCGIADLSAVPGDCNPDGTYQLKINFSLLTVPPGNTPFTVFADNGQSLGTFTTADLPLVIQHFPWNGNAVDAVKICIGNSATTFCCRVKEFKAPDCTGAPCGIFNLKVEAGDCNDDGTYPIDINFQTTGLAGAFGVWAGNGQFLGSFPLASLPLHIQHFPGTGGGYGVVKICLIGATAGTPLCCVTKEFKAPDCTGDPCHIQNLTVSTGDCTSDSTYQVKINFQLSNPTLTTLFAVYANGQLFGQYPLSALPLLIPNFPYNGGPNDVVKVCIVTPAAVLCCETKEFPVPPCLNAGPCSIYDLVVDLGDCTSDSTYKLALNFKVNNPGVNGKFGVWSNGTLVGYYTLSNLPLSIPNFPWGGGPVDVVKVCIVTSNTSSSTCCAVKEFKVPVCLLNECTIYDLKVETGKCNDSTGTYEAWINFKVDNAPTLSNFFGVWANGQFLGFFQLNQLPLYIPKFPTDGGPNDVVKVCLSNTGALGCCAVKEFPVPDCAGGPCEIYDLKVETGDCNPDGTYKIVINFKVQNPGNDYFEVYSADGTKLGFFKLSELPLTIQNFKGSGGDIDKIRVCINDHPNYCRVAEFKAPDCTTPPPCEIYDLKVETGDCNADGTYHAWIIFKTNNPGNTGVFGVWANGTFLGTYPLSNAPLHIEHFPTDGGPNDVVKVCLLTPGTTLPLCCATKEFAVPDCVSNHPCDIYDLKVETGDCNPDGTYHAWVNFKVDPVALSLFYNIWANGKLLGTFPVTSLPFHIEHFPTDGGPNDVVKVCVVTPNAANPLCCETLEFKVPDCPGVDCNIYDLAVQHTPCLCGQFFAILNFGYKGGGSGGFDIRGNGVNYGNFPYNTPQPIILGPLDGDGVTEYEFVVRDHLHPDCHDAVVLGKVDCTPAIQARAKEQASAGKLVLAPNPVSDWLSVTALLNTGTIVGQAAVEIRQADGRLLRTLVIANGSNFQLDVSELQAGIYRLSLQTEVARLEASFAKQ